MSRNIVLSILAMVFIVGCGQGPEQFQGVSTSRDHIKEGMEHLKKSDIPKAVKSFDRAIKQDPNNPENYIILGQVYMRLNNYPRAVDTLSAAVRVSPNHGEAHFLLAMSKAVTGDREGAIESAQKSVDIFMKSRDEDKFKRSVVLLKGLTEGQETAGQQTEEETTETQ